MTTYTPASSETTPRMATITVQGLNIFFREAGKASNPKLVSRQPRTLFFWGQDDSFFTREGGEAYLGDIPNAELHRLDSGHFAVEDCLEYIARRVRRFYAEHVRTR